LQNSIGGRNGAATRDQYRSWLSRLAHPDPERPEQSHFNTIQEAVRKDIERAFGVLVSQWHILAQFRNWDAETIKVILIAASFCTI
jgi:hypothetical protein